jgi:hypothetical protein
LERRAGIAAAQIPQVTADALNITAKHIVRTIQSRMPSIFDRPTKFTLNALRISGARPSGNPHADVLIKDSARLASIHYLQPQISGGGRSQKRFEYLLGGPSAWFMPGGGAQLDAYGNVTSATYNQVLSQLHRRLDQQQNESDVSRAKRLKKQGKQKGVVRGDFFQVFQGDNNHLKPGIYQRVKVGNFGTTLKPIFIQGKAPQYRARFPFQDMVADQYLAEYPDNLQRAISETLNGKS